MLRPYNDAIGAGAAPLIPARHIALIAMPDIAPHCGPGLPASLPAFAALALRVRANLVFAPPCAQCLALRRQRGGNEGGYEIRPSMTAWRHRMALHSIAALISARRIVVIASRCLRVVAAVR
jgi:hypothetical protein